MATAGEGSSYEGAGAGGKFRRRPLRKSSTPYDRPPNAIRKTSEAGRASWLLKLVDPASRIITNSAQRFFSSVFGKNNPPALPSVPEANNGPRNESPGVVSHNPSPEAHERVHNERITHNNSETNVINDLEQILKQKTFTRDEIDRLTELLRSRTVEVSVEDEKKRIEPSTSQLMATQLRIESVPVQEVQGQSGLVKTSLPVVQSSFHDEDVATPAELAKAYMGSRTSNITPSKLGLRSQTSREDVASLTTVPFAPKSPSTSLVPKSAVNYNSAPRISGNGFLTPGLRGRSALYSMARTPYSRVQHTTAHKAVGFLTVGNADPSGSSQQSWENNILSGGKQVSKRRSSVLENDIGSVGPIRRIRQKTNMMSPSKGLSSRSPGTSLPIPLTPVRSDAAQGSLSSIQKSRQLNEPKHKSVEGLVENGDSIASTSFASVPSQSSEMARKILQQLDKFVPSPKEKSPELKLATALETSSTKLTHDMLRGRALKSMEDVDSSNQLHLDGVGNNHMLGARDSTCQKQVKIDENGPNKNSISRDKLGAEANGVVTAVFTKDSMPTVNTAAAISSIDANPPQKRRAFQISAHEDSVDFDEDSFSDKVGSIPVSTDEGKSDALLVESKAIFTETVTVEKPVEKLPVTSSEINPPASGILKKPSVVGASDATPISGKDSGFTFPVTQAPLTSPQSATVNESTSASVFGFGSKSGDKATPFTVSSTSVSEISVPKFGAQSETLSSVTDATRTTPSAFESEKSTKDENQKAGDLFNKVRHAVSSPVSAPTTSLFSFAACNNNSSPNDGSIASPSSLFSVPAASLTSGKSTNNVSSSIPQAATTTDVTSSPSVFAATTSTFSAAPMFKFESSTSVATAPNSAPLSLATSGMASTDTELKTKHTSPFGNLNSSPFGATSSAFTSSSSSTFVFGASAPSSAQPLFDNNQLQGSNNSAAVTGSSSSPFVFGAATSSGKPSSSDNNQFQGSNIPSAVTSESSLSVQASPRTAVATFTQSMPMQFNSSASPTFGLSGSSVSSGGLFGSSPSANFGSSSGFGTNSSTTFGAGSGTTSSLFTSASQPATSSIFGSAFGSTSSSTGFTFGSSSAVSATVGSAPMTFGSSPGASSSSMFSFTSAAATSSAPNPASFPVFGASSAAVTFGSASPGNDQMNMEDSMAEDTMQASTPVPGFGQPVNSPPPNLLFGSPSGQNMFQMNGQQTPPVQQNLSQFQASGSLGFSAGGSFSLGTGGGDKSNRKYIKIRRKDTRKR